MNPAPSMLQQGRDGPKPLLNDSWLARWSRHNFAWRSTSDYASGAFLCPLTPNQSPRPRHQTLSALPQATGLARCLSRPWSGRAIQVCAPTYGCSGLSTRHARLPLLQTHGLLLHLPYRPLTRSNPPQPPPPPPPPHPARGFCF
jgi:hypothetical protein